METQAQPTHRPLRLGELLDRAIRLYRGNFLTFIGIIAVVYVPLMVLQTASTALMNSSSTLGRDFSTPDDSFITYAPLIGFVTFMILIFVQIVLVQGIATGALTRAVADNYLGKRTGIIDAYRGIGKSWLTLLAALFFVFLVFFVLILVSTITCIGLLIGPGMALFLMTAVNPLVAPVVVLEAPGPWSSSTDNIFQRFSNWTVRSMLVVNRAWSLARRRFWPVLGYIVVLYLFSLIVVNGPSAIANLLLGQISESFGDTTMQVVLTSIIQGLVQLVFVLIYYPLQMAAFTLIYFDLRVRTEGFDLAFLTMEASGSTDLSEAMTVSVPQVNERFMTWTEVGNFIILTLAGVGLYFLFASFIAAIMFFLFSLMG
jgi:hypothetical protein